jgi:hypothetical protein
LTLDEHTSHAFTAAEFGFSDPADASGGAANVLQAVVITSLPTAGALTLSGVLVTAGQSIALAQIPNLVFTPNAGVSGTPYASFTFQVVGPRTRLSST